MNRRHFERLYEVVFEDADGGPEQLIRTVPARTADDAVKVVRIEAMVLESDREWRPLSCRPFDREPVFDRFGVAA